MPKSCACLHGMNVVYSVTRIKKQHASEHRGSKISYGLPLTH